MKLEQLHIPKPCDEPWEEMSGGDTARFCDKCQHDVHDLSAMTRREAEALLAREGSALCVRYVMRGEELVFAPEPGPRLMAQLQGLNRLVAAAALAVPLLLAGCDVPPPEPTAQPPIIIQEGQPAQLQGASRAPAPPPQASPPPVKGEAAEEAVVVGRPRAYDERVVKGEPAPVDELLMGKPAMPAPEEAEEPCDKAEGGDVIEDAPAAQGGAKLRPKMGRFVPAGKR
jgi:hypothetical protein